MRCKEWIKDDSGFSLVEVILALTILALVTLPVINYFTYSSVRTIDGRERQTATMAAEDVAEELKAYSNIEQIEELVATPMPGATAAPPASDSTYLVRVFYKYSYTVPTNMSAITPATIESGLSRVICLDIREGSNVLAGAATPSPAPLASPTPTPDSTEAWSIDPSPLPEYTVEPAADPLPMDITRNVVVNNSKYKAKVHFDFDVYDSDTKAKDGSDIDAQYNDYHIPSPSEVYGNTNVVAAEDDEVDSAVSEIYTDVMAASTPGHVIQKEVTLEQTEISKSKLKNIFIFYKPAWDSSRQEHFKVIGDPAFTEEEMKKINIYFTYQDLSVPAPGETPDPSVDPAPGVSDIGTYALRMDQSDINAAVHAKYYSNLNRPDYPDTTIHANFTLQKNSLNKYDSYVSKVKKRRIGKMYVDIFPANAQEFTKDNVLAHIESTYAE